MPYISQVPWLEARVTQVASNIGKYKGQMVCLDKLRFALKAHGEAFKITFQDRPADWIQWKVEFTTYKRFWKHSGTFPGVQPLQWPPHNSINNPFGLQPNMVGAVGGSPNAGVPSSTPAAAAPAAPAAAAATKKAASEEKKKLKDLKKLLKGFNWDKLHDSQLLCDTLQEYAYRAEEGLPGAPKDLIRYKAELYTFMHFWESPRIFPGINPQPLFRPVSQPNNDRPPIHPSTSSHSSSQTPSQAATFLKIQTPFIVSSPTTTPVPGRDLKYAPGAFARRDQDQEKQKQAITRAEWAARADEMAACFTDIYPVAGTELAHVEPLVIACFSTEMKRARYRMYKALPRSKRAQWQCLRQITMKGHQMAKVDSIWTAHTGSQSVYPTSDALKNQPKIHSTSSPMTDNELDQYKKFDLGRSDVEASRENEMEQHKKFRLGREHAQTDSGGQKDQQSRLDLVGEHTKHSSGRKNDPPSVEKSHPNSMKPGDPPLLQGTSVQDFAFHIRCPNPQPTPQPTPKPPSRLTPQELGQGHEPDDRTMLYDPRSDTGSGKLVHEVEKSVGPHFPLPMIETQMTNFTLPTTQPRSREGITKGSTWSMANTFRNYPQNQSQATRALLSNGQPGVTEVATAGQGKTSGNGMKEGGNQTPKMPRMQQSQDSQGSGSNQRSQGIQAGKKREIEETEVDSEQNEGIEGKRVRWYL
ncbi:hypothetical protein B7494_g3547 [Chlorociboria aeruginascens]|nr:hypothetical protein B7494_g3547 [Chlorociboria aeruginascens]